MSKVVFIIINIFVFTFYICNGLYVLSLNRKNKTHITFFIMAVVMAYFSLGCVLFQVFEKEESVLLFYMTGTALSILMLVLAIFISLQLSDLFRLKPLHYALILIPGIFLAVKLLLADPSVDFLYYNNSWRLSGILNQAVFYLYYIIFIAYTLLYATVNLFWYLNTPVKREKKQAIVLLLSAIISIGAYAAFMILFFNVFKIIRYEYAGSSSISFLIWSSGFTFCLARYRLLSLTPEIVSRDIISAIDELIILSDPRGSIITINEKVNALTGHEIKDNAALADIIPGFSRVKPEIDRLLLGKFRDFSCTINLLKRDKEEISVDAKFSLIRDKYGDPMGILIIAREAREFSRLRMLYKISKSEANIIRLISEGHRNRDIADVLGIKETTLKRHVTNIYSKLKIINKVELMNLLNEFDLAPDRRSERVLLVADKK